MGTLIRLGLGKLNPHRCLGSRKWIMMTVEAETILSIINSKADEEMKILECRNRFGHRDGNVKVMKMSKSEKKKMDVKTGKRGGV